jgi:hypothetical protein
MFENSGEKFAGAGSLGPGSLAIFSLWRCLRGGVVIKIPHNNNSRIENREIYGFIQSL